MKYTDEQIDFLKKMSFGRSRKELTKMFNQKFQTLKTIKQIQGTCKRYKFYSGNTGRFEKGNIPKNKGKKNPGKTNSGSFKKGHTPKNYRPVGSKRIDKDGIEYTKIRDPRTWKQSHVLLWEKHYGQVPKGHIVIFKDLDKRNLCIANLMMISKKENLTLNRKKWRNEDPDITESRVNIVRVINKSMEKKLST